MTFKRICQIPGSKACLVNSENESDSCGIDPNPTQLALYQLLARISGISAQKEIGELEKGLSS